MEVLRERLSSSSFRVQYLVLVIVEALVKNCGPRFHRALACEKFMNQMKAVVKVRGVRACSCTVWADSGVMEGVGCVVCCVQGTEKHRGRDAIEAQVKALELIQHWGEEFLTRRGEGTDLFVTTYHELRAKGEHPAWLPLCD